MYNDVFRYMKHIFFMYRCNSVIGFGGQMIDILSVSVVSGVEICGQTVKQGTPVKQLLTYQNVNKRQLMLYSQFVY